ncbi:DUF4192 domain-containing protein [Nocardia sp. NPDC051570]|uniref:DUF4192 domain-containing protein n=1 Tax=Nocardia sp. NPDC051570 TaxID=3364324 RepID=UPI00379A88DE
MTTPAEPVPGDNGALEAPRDAARPPICGSPKCRAGEPRSVPRLRGGPPAPTAPGEPCCSAERSVDHGFEPLWPDPRLRLDDASEFIAAVPALLGFMPERSLVVCMLREAPDHPDSLSLGIVARHDLDVFGCGAWARLAGQLATICVQERTLAVLLLIVDDRAGAPRAGRPGARSARHRELVRVLCAALEAEDVVVGEVCAVREIAGEAPWWSLLEPDVGGLQSNPADSPITLAHVLDGRPIRTSREELMAVVAPDPRAAAEVAAVLEQAETRARDQYRRAVCRCEPGSYSRAALEMVLWSIAAVDSGELVRARELAELAVALRDPTVRDALFALAVGDHAHAAETVWTLLCQATTGADRAEAATLLGYSAYVRGDGPLAGVAFAAALHAEPGHRITALLDTALRTGMPPREVRKLARSGRDKAAAVGVDLGIDAVRWDR